MDDWLSSAARRRPDHPALVADGETATYGELDAAASRAARRLAARGVGAGERVATTLPPGRAFTELLHAAPRLGAVLVPLDPSAPAKVDAGAVVAEPLDGPEAQVALRGSFDPDAVHSLLHTSGTTGAPRPVELTYRNHHASAAASATLLGVDPADRWLSPLPVFHVGGLAVLLRSAIYGTTAVVHGRFDLERVRRLLEAGAVTLASLVPTMLHRLLEAGLERAPALRAALVGGGPVRPELVALASERGLPVRATYGMTETASQVATAAPGETAASPLPGVELRIAENGEILVRGPMVAPRAAGPGGWLHTGDLGALDEQGRLHVRGRRKELIVTGGESVVPAEVEAALLEHPAVDDAGVVGLPDAEWGEAVAAFVVLDGAASEDELIAHCRRRLHRHKVPKRVEQVASLPRSPAGKLLRDEIVP